MPSNCSPIVLLPLLAVLVLTSGCGTAAYDEQMQATLIQLSEIKRSRVSLKDLYGYIDSRNPIDGGAVDVRVPLAFTTVFNIYSKDSANNLPVDPSKLYPAGIELQGYDRTFEAKSEDAQGSRWPYYLYIATRNVPDDQADQAAQELLERYRPAATSMPEQWEEIEIKDLAKVKKSWKKLTFEGDFFFDKFGADGKADWSKYPGVVDFYLYQESGRQVLLGCLQLKGFESATMLDELMPLMASTLKIVDIADDTVPQPVVAPQPAP